MQETNERFCPEYANLYVEKYANGELLLDFINEEEFLFFRNRWDYSPQMHLEHYEPSQILIHNVRDFKVNEREVFVFPMETLFNLRQFSNMSRFDEQFSNIEMELEYDDNVLSAFRESRKLKRKDVKKFEKLINGTWQQGTPCALENLKGKIEVCVLDVGQGSINFIKDNSNLTIFDFGTSIYAKQHDMKKIINSHRRYFDDAENVSLIISHWDCDHYNLLTSVEDEFLKELCCVFVPEKVISLTAKNVVKRIEANCQYIRTFSSPVGTAKTIGMQLIVQSPSYELFIGERTVDLNKSGLALTVYGENSAMMFTADHTNEQVWGCMYPAVNNRIIDGLFVVVPHHGGNCGRIKCSKPLHNARCAIVSVGKNSYKHPNQKALDEYESLGFNVVRTDWERKDIILHL